MTSWMWPPKGSCHHIERGSPSSTRLLQPQESQVCYENLQQRTREIVQQVNG